MLTQCTVRFRDEDRSNRLREDISAVYLTPDNHLWIAADELMSLERLRWDGTQFDEHQSFAIAAFFDLPCGGEHEIDIEGLEQIDDRMLLGLRGPVLLDWAILLEMEFKEQRGGTLTLRRIGPKRRPYRKHFVNLRGLGIRDLCRVDDDLLILAGPTLYLDGPHGSIGSTVPVNWTTA